jgi:hypothetical protein
VGRTKRLRMSLLPSISKNPAAAGAYKALANGSPTAISVVEDSVSSAMCSQDAKELLLGIYGAGEL